MLHSFFLKLYYIGSVVVGLYLNVQGSTRVWSCWPTHAFFHIAAIVYFLTEKIGETKKKKVTKLLLENVSGLLFKLEEANPLNSFWATAHSRSKFIDFESFLSSRWEFGCVVPIKRHNNLLGL